jgi:hypothetical protein
MAKISLTRYLEYCEPYKENMAKLSLARNYQVCYIVAVLLVGGNQSTCRKRPTCHKSFTNFITYSCIEYTSS